MLARSYLPSRQFLLVMASFVVGGGLIFGAYRTAYPPQAAPAALASDASGADWRSQFSGNTAFEESQRIADTAQALASSSATDNLTDTIGRTLLINTSAAAGQNIAAGADVQGQIVSSALSRIQSALQQNDIYAASDIASVPDSAAALHSYGNALIEAIRAHSEADYASAMTAVGIAVDAGDASRLKGLSSTASAYEALASAVAAIPAPQSLAPSALELANNYARMARSCRDMSRMLSDPILGIAGLQQFNAFSDENTRLFTQIASVLQKNAILFNKNEAGSSWAVFLDAETRSAAQAQSSNPSQ